MINDFILSASNKMNTSTSNQLNKLEDITTEITQSIQSSTSPVIDAIKKIEEYNSNKSIPLNKRIEYWVNVDGTINLLQVFHTHFFGTNGVQLTVYNRNGSPDMKYNKDGIHGEPSMESARQSLSTVITTTDKLYSISFGSYDKTYIDEILNDSAAKEARIPNLENLLRNELNKLNSLRSSGKLRDYYIEFNKFMHDNGLFIDPNTESTKSSITPFDFNREACNLYNTIWKNYLLLTETIVDKFESDTEKDPEIGLFVDTDGNEDKESYKLILQ